MYALEWDRDMNYDIIIIGAGPAGLACGLTLARAGKKCLILERRRELTGKVCGDGLSSHCMQVLKNINIQEKDLISLGGKKIYRNVTSNFGEIEERRYCRNEGYEDYAYGLSRDVFDGYLLRLAREAGCEVMTDRTVLSIRKNGSGYLVDGSLTADRVVLACGAIGGQKLGVAKPDDVPVGMSARVYGDCRLPSDTFYFKYDWQYGEGYAWLFPVGERLWNYGVWSADRREEVKRLFAEFEEQMKKTYFSDCSYERKPKGAVIGATRHMPTDGTKIPRIGDCAYISCFESGEGISYAIESGRLQAEAILHDRDPEKVPVPERNAYANEVKKCHLKSFEMIL